MDINIAEMGRRIRAARREKNLSPEQLASQIGITPESLGHVECGVRKPSLQTLCNIADALDVSADYLLCRTSSSDESIIRREVQSQDLSPEQEKMLRELIRGMIPAIRAKIK